jgi:hypothetical protein
MPLIGEPICRSWSSRPTRFSNRAAFARTRLQRDLSLEARAQRSDLRYRRRQLQCEANQAFSSQTLAVVRNIRSSRAVAVIRGSTWPMRHKGIGQADDDARERDPMSAECIGRTNPACLLPGSLGQCIRLSEFKAVALQLVSSTTLLYYPSVKFNQGGNEAANPGARQRGTRRLAAGSRRYPFQLRGNTAKRRGPLACPLRRLRPISRWT